jgi:hypothetical protein
VTVFGGDGDDRLDLVSVAGDPNLNTTISFDGGAGNNEVNVVDDNINTQQQYTITSNSIRILNGPQTTFSSVSLARLTGGSGGGNIIITPA